jgi:lipopolysaccharide heptosyltransferase II
MRQPLNRSGKPKINLSSTKKILLIRLRRIGDIVMTTPAVTALRNGLPQAFISYVVEEPYSQLIEGNPNLDKAVILPRNVSAGDFFKFIRQIRKEKYDLIVDFHGGPRAFLIALLSGARLKAGYRTKYKHFIYDIKLPRDPQEGSEHSVEGHLNLVRALGIEIPSTPLLCLPDARETERNDIQKLWRENSLENAKAVVIHISAGNEFRDWGIDNLAVLISQLSEIPGVKTILIGGEDDRKAAQEIREKCKAPLISFVGHLNLSKLRHIISLSSLFVGPDSGPMHIAASTKTPIVAYFGPTLPATFSPWKADAHILEKEFDCRPCRQRQCVYDDFRCLRNITPKEVFNACLDYLQ